LLRGNPDAANTVQAVLDRHGAEARREDAGGKGRLGGGGGAGLQRISHSIAPETFCSVDLSDGSGHGRLAYLACTGRLTQGALAPIYGTVVTSVIALAIAAPLGMGIAIFLTELCPPALRRPIGTAIELLAGIPSIIYGIWGLFVFAPFLQTYLQPFLIEIFSNVPVLNSLFAGPPYGIGILTASLILAMMRGSSRAVGVSK